MRKRRALRAEPFAGPTVVAWFEQHDALSHVYRVEGLNHCEPSLNWSACSPLYAVLVAFTTTARPRHGYPDRVELHVTSLDGLVDEAVLYTQNARTGVVTFQWRDSIIEWRVFREA